jgi:hypothetical protein
LRRDLRDGGEIETVFGTAARWREALVSDRPV